RLMRRFMFAAAGCLTLVHAAVAFTPLYGVVVGGLLGVPREVLEPARLGLRIMLPWTLAIAFRRFHQGVLIRAGQSRAVGLGTGVRLGSNAAVLALGYVMGTIPGIVVGTVAVAAGVVGEATYAGIRVRPALRRLAAAPAPDAP